MPRHPNCSEVYPGLLAEPIRIKPGIDRDGAVLIALSSSPELRFLHLQTRTLGSDGLRPANSRLKGRAITVIAANSERGLLYGAFALLRQIQTHRSLDHLDTARSP